MHIIVSVTSVITPDIIATCVALMSRVTEIPSSRRPGIRYIRKKIIVQIIFLYLLLPQKIFVSFV